MLLYSVIIMMYVIIMKYFGKYPHNVTRKQIAPVGKDIYILLSSRPEGLRTVEIAMSTAKLRKPAP